MSRIQFFEFEDLKWFPTIIRNYLTDYLQFLSNQVKIFDSVLPIIQKALKKEGTNQIVDLASGGGGGLIGLNNELLKNNPDLQILLTDYYPNIDAFKYAKNQTENLDFVAEPVDARKVPKHLKGLRTQFLSFHHFEPKDAIQILQNAVDSNSSIAIFEAQERSAASFFAMLMSPFSVLFTAPFIRPFKFGRIIYTYLIPIVPIIVPWDGVVSCLRTYSIKEMENLVAQVKNKDQFEWEIGKIKKGPAVNLYLLGMKK